MMDCGLGFMYQSGFCMLGLTTRGVAAAAYNT
jgi:hypothetical protein